MTHSELERVASLAGHPGFAALLKVLDEADGILLDKLEGADSVKEKEILSLWRASRRIRKILAGRPEQILEEIGGIGNRDPL